MSTLKAVLGREAERSNLRNVGLCVAAVICVVVIAFGLVHLKPMVHATVAGVSADVATVGPGNTH